jgi:WD40 repeat protein
VDFRQETPAAFDELLAACQSEMEAAPPAAQREPKKKPTKRKPKPEKPPEQAEALAVLERTLMGHHGWVNSVAVSPDGKWAASGSGTLSTPDSTVKIWDLETGESRATLEGHTDQVQSVAITPDGKRILSGSEDKTVRVWDAGSGREVAKLKGHTSRIWTVVALRDNARALSGGWDNTLILWDLASGRCLKTIECGTEKADNVFSSAVDPAETKALSGHRDGSVRFWNLETGECLATLKSHSKMVASLQITPNGRFAVSGSNDNTVKVWDLEAGTCVGTLEGHQNRVLSVAFSPDGTLIASTGFLDGTIRLWDWKLGACLQVIKHDGSPFPISVAFSPDGARLVVGTTEFTIYVYRLTGVRTEPSAELTRRYVNAKVVLLGEGMVGKTSLAYRLIEDKYVVKDRTHGMNVWSLALPPDAILDREALTMEAVWRLRDAFFPLSARTPYGEGRCEATVGHTNG